MHSKPSKQKETRFKIYSSGDIPSPLLDMPDVGYAQYLINYLFEMGFSKRSAMGLQPIDWLELHSWSIVTKTELTNWECNVLIHCSNVYVDQYYESNEQIVPAPYQPINIDKVAVSNRVANLFRSLMGKKDNSNHGSIEQEQTQLD